MKLVTPRIYFIITAIALIVACKTDEQKMSDRQYELFRTQIAEDSLNGMAESSAEFVYNYHYDTSKKYEAQKWLIAYKKKTDELKYAEQEEKKENDSLELIAEKFGGYKLIEIDTKAKCNMYRGYYMLNKNLTDSASLAFLASHLANKLFKSSPVLTSKCDNYRMSQAFIYQPGISDRSHWASMCTISPVDNYQGEVTVNTNTLK